MQTLALNYKKSNPGSKVQVINYEPRPMLCLTPPQWASDPRVMNFNFIEAITKLPARFAKKDLAAIMKTTIGKFKGQLLSLFVVLSDDQRGGDSDESSHRHGRGHRCQRDDSALTRSRVLLLWAVLVPTILHQSRRPRSRPTLRPEVIQLLSGMMPRHPSVVCPSVM